MTAPKRRASDHRWGRLSGWWFRWGADVTTTIAIALATFAVFGVRSTVRDLEQEGTERRDQSCLIFETKQRGDVRALERTYNYLSGLSAHELGESINRAVLANLPNVIREAQTDDAPAYCDEPNVGLPEPDDRIPKRPKNLPPG